MTDRYACAHPPRTCSRRARLGLVALLTVLASLAAASDTPRFDDTAYFAEPLSGRRVTGYSIELPLRAEGRQAFAVPGDCAAVLAAIEARQAMRGSIVDRRMWRKVEDDCWYHAFLHRHPRVELQDHVSNYDFMNAQIGDLPIDRRCANAADPAACRPGATDERGVLRHFPLTEPAGTPMQQEAEGDCLLRDGLLHGRIYAGPEGIRCDTVSGHEPTLRLIGVDFADINGDHYLDAVLRFVPVGRGLARSPLILPLTRKQADGPFTVPEHGAIAFPSD